MIDQPVALDDMERDALTELVNVGIGRAAINLRTMINHEVRLSVPSVAITKRSQLALSLSAHGETGLVAVRQSFEGEVSGRAMLIFPETNSLELVRAVTGGTLPVEDIVALEHEALAETGNVILNGCLAAIANMLRRSLRMSLPEVIRGSAMELFGPPRADDIVLLIYINFAVDAREIKGYIAMVMDLPALRTLRQLLRGLIGAGGTAVAASHATP